MAALRCALRGFVAHRPVLPRPRAAAPVTCAAAQPVAPRAYGDAPQQGNPAAADIHYANYPLSRCSHLRQDTDHIKQLYAAKDARIVAVHRGKCLVRPRQGPDAPKGSLEAVYVPRTAAPNDAFVGPLCPIFLGQGASDVPYFACVVDDEQAAVLGEHHEATWERVRGVGPALPRDDAAVLAVAQGLVLWHLAHVYHGATGEATHWHLGGHARVAQDGRSTVYPRIDPAVITLVTAGDYCLLGRKLGWDATRYSTLAGFLEVGETLEEALCREVQEESGVAVAASSIRYFASQPWPFPQSLMIGFHASADAPPPLPPAGGYALLSEQGRQAAQGVGLRPEEAHAVLWPPRAPPRPEPDEMEDVRWFHRDWLRGSLAGAGGGAVTAGWAFGGAGLTIPGPTSLANRLLSSWLAEGDEQTSSPLDAVPQVNIDEGVFKYVLLRLRHEQAGTRLAVWGHSSAAFHMYIFQKAKQLAHQADIEVETLGGGRIEHYLAERQLSVYGYSSAFGQAPHDVTAALLQKQYPFHDVSVSFDGY